MLSKKKYKKIMKKLNNLGIVVKNVDVSPNDIVVAMGEYLIPEFSVTGNPLRDNLILDIENMCVSEWCHYLTRLKMDADTLETDTIISFQYKYGVHVGDKLDMAKIKNRLSKFDPIDFGMYNIPDLIRREVDTVFFDGVDPMLALYNIAMLIEFMKTEVSGKAMFTGNPLIGELRIAHEAGKVKNRFELLVEVIGEDVVSLINKLDTRSFSSITMFDVRIINL